MWLLLACTSPPSPTPISDGTPTAATDTYATDTYATDTETLTPRESEVLGLLAQGLTNREIGSELKLAEKTVKHHVTQILNKLHVRSRTEAALVAQRRSDHGNCGSAARQSPRARRVLSLAIRRHRQRACATAGDHRV